MMHRRKPVILSWDPPNAVALVQGDTLLMHDHWTMAKKSDLWLSSRVNEILQVSIPQVLDGSIDVLVVEGQYLHVFGDDAPHVKRGKQRGSLVLSYRAGIIAGICMVATGLECTRLDPDKWQTAMVGRGGREQRKKMSLLRARSMTGIELTVDESDAYLMGAYQGSII